MMALPAFHLSLGARAKGPPLCSIQGYPGVVLNHVTAFSSISTVALACRKIFDHKVKGQELTGAKFAKCSDETLAAVAEYWASNPGKSIADATAALRFLRSVFRDCAKSDQMLFESPSSLGRRIGLLNQYGDQVAAHLSVEDYEFTTNDCAHVVAALTMLAAIIVSFDDPTLAPDYFDTLDAAAASAARQMFPAAQGTRLFWKFNVETQSRSCWQMDPEVGRHLLHEGLPDALGLY
jgi:hypothetical protein